MEHNITISNCTSFDALQQNYVNILNTMLEERQDNSFEAITKVFLYTYVGIATLYLSILL